MRKFLIVVDMQKDFVNGALGTPEAAAIVPRVAEKIQSFPAKSLSRWTPMKRTISKRRRGRSCHPHCIRNTAGWQLDQSVAAALSGKNYTVVEKPTFGSTRLPALLAEPPTGRHFPWSSSDCVRISALSAMRCSSRRISQRCPWLWTPPAVPASAPKPMKPHLQPCSAARSMWWKAISTFPPRKGQCSVLGVFCKYSDGGCNLHWHNAVFSSRRSGEGTKMKRYFAAWMLLFFLLCACDAQGSSRTKNAHHQWADGGICDGGGGRRRRHLPRDQ